MQAGRAALALCLALLLVVGRAPCSFPDLSGGSDAAGFNLTDSPADEPGDGEPETTLPPEHPQVVPSLAVTASPALRSFTGLHQLVPCARGPPVPMVLS